MALFRDQNARWPLFFWFIHTLMLVLFLALERVGFHMPVGSSLFWFAWMAAWLIHGLVLLLGRAREQESAAGDVDGAAVRFRRRIMLAVHTALYLAFGPAVMLWWLVARPPGPQQPGEGQGLWIYPVWLMLLLAHSAYVVRRERQPISLNTATKRKNSPVRYLTDDGELQEVDEDVFPLHHPADDQQRLQH
ncbi:MAG: hypothetical protein R3E39_15645 [Anaerolineae bacterium]